MDFQQAIIDGIVQQFFKPTITGFNQQTNEPFYGSSGAATLSQTFFQQNRQVITERVIAKLKVEDVADMVYKKLLEDLKAKDTGYGYGVSYDSVRAKKEFNESVRKQVVKLVAQAQAAKMMAASDADISVESGEARGTEPAS